MEIRAEVNYSPKFQASARLEVGTPPREKPPRNQPGQRSKMGERRLAVDGAGPTEARAEEVLVLDSSTFIQEAGLTSRGASALKHYLIPSENTSSEQQVRGLNFKELSVLSRVL